MSPKTLCRYIYYAWLFYHQPPNLITMRYFYVSKYFGNCEFDLNVTYFVSLLTGITANVRTTFSTMSLQVQNCKFTNQGQKVNILKQSELQRKTFFLNRPFYLHQLAHTLFVDGNISIGLSIKISDSNLTLSLALLALLQ